MRSHANRSLVDIVLSGAKAQPTRTAVNMPSGMLTHLQFKDVVVSFALHFKEHGVDRSSCIALDLHHPIPVVAASLAAALLGCSWAPASPPVMMNRRVLGITHLIHDDRGVDEQIRALANDRQMQRIRLDSSWMSPPPSNRAVLRQFRGYSSPAETWMIAQSSGTTGTPKFVGLSERIAIQRLSYPFADKQGVLAASCLLYPW